MKFLSVVLALMLGLAIAALMVVAHQAPPTTAELDDDIRSLKAEISRTDSEAAALSGGLLLAEIQLRAAIQRNTLAMLQQKRKAFFRAINLEYRDAIPRLEPKDNLKSETEALEEARSVAKTAHAEAEQYSGGLILALIQSREATAKLTEAQIEQQMILSKFGIPLAVPGSKTAILSPNSTPGKVTSDRDALQ